MDFKFWTWRNEDDHYFKLHICINWKKKSAGMDIKMYLISKSQNTQIGVPSTLEGLKKENKNKLKRGNVKGLNLYSLLCMDFESFKTDAHE